ncbi:MAG: ribosome maturation factor RimP [Myxococcota bacterium]|jgi:ribosome maturation factor RimP|nr:ribosome maturation factor RimP [Myxococcota bacterium]
MPLLPEIERLRALIEPQVEARALMLYDVELITTKRVPLLRVLVDRPDRSQPGTGVSIEELVQLNHALSALFDEVDPIHSAYRLEVSSPGLERKLSERRHYEGALGEKVRLQLTRSVGGKPVLEGILRALEGEELVLERAPVGKAPRKSKEPVAEPERWRVALADVKQAQTVYHWQRGEKKKF